MYSLKDDYDYSQTGFPIRKFTDYKLFAPHRNLSQLATSFFASQSLGIHLTLLHFYALASLVKNPQLFSYFISLSVKDLNFMYKIKIHHHQSLLR